VTVRHAWLCDFDGTIAPRDIGAEFMRRFATTHAPEWESMLERWRLGTLGSRELAEFECAQVRVTPREALEFIRQYEIDPHFAGFAREAIARGEQVLVVSDGFEFYVADRLAAAGLADLPRAANRLRFESGSVVPEFPFAGRGCGRCGNCKGEHVREARARGSRVTLVGDGFSDRCAARLADRVLARGSLAAWCAAEGIAAEPFADFADVARFGRRLAEESAGASPHADR